MDALQELYAHLEHHHYGDRYMAWYGQARAKGLSHKDALEDTLNHFDIRSRHWYKARGLHQTIG